MKQLRLISCDSRDEWMRVVGMSVYHDFYHLPFFHAIARDLGEGEPSLFVYEHEGYTIALPLLIRSILSTAAEDFGAEPWYDATSVYGYAGPLASHIEIPSAILTDFQASLGAELSRRRIVSVFSRLHPFSDQSMLLSGLGQLVNHGRTVSIDLRDPEDEQRAQYRTNHLREIRKLRELGVLCVPDIAFNGLIDFVDLYHSTMKRVHAAPEYFYPRSYFEKLAGTKEAEVLLVMAYLEGQSLAGGIFIRCDTTMEYHLGGGYETRLKHAPMKIVLDTARHWAYENGVQTFHLGGGVGSHEDSLFHFKKGFSNRMHPFRTWRWIVLPEVYARLSTRHERWLEDHGHPAPAEDFFPKYRATVPIVQS